MKQNRVIKTALALLFIFHSLLVSGQVNQENIPFKSFEIERNDNKIILNWAMNEGMRCNYFEVERSRNGKNFKTIMIVFGADPSNIELDKFESTVLLSTKNKRYYRLKHINKEGILTYSPVKAPSFNQ